MIATDQLLEVFVDVADTLVDDFDVIEFLHNVADHTVAVTGASSTGILLADENEQLRYMAASSLGAKHLELFQLQSSEGPCLECFRSREPVICNNLADAAQRWPHFASRAMSIGVHSVHAFPLRLREHVIGALNVFGDEPLPLEPADAKVVQALADVATIAILQERAIAVAETLTEQLQGALNSRIVIEQAKGVISRSNGLGVDEAFDVLRSHARTHQLRLTNLAHAVVTGGTDPTAWASVTSPGGPPRSVIGEAETS